jgi:hypothetical protein
MAVWRKQQSGAIMAQFTERRQIYADFGAV